MTNTYSSVAKRILQLIDDEGLSFGEKLPAERALASTFNVSRNSVREAIRSLTNKGILASRRGAGTYIAAPEHNVLSDRLLETLKGDASSKDIFQLRYILEPQVASLAALNATPEQIQNLKIMAFDMSHGAMAGSDVTAMDLEFHLAIAKCTGNDLLINLIDCLDGILALSRSLEQDEEERVAMAAKAHFKIVEAIAEGNALKAQEAMKEHIQYVEIRVRGEGAAVEPFDQSGGEKE